MNDTPVTSGFGTELDVEPWHGLVSTTTEQPGSKTQAGTDSADQQLHIPTPDTPTPDTLTPDTLTPDTLTPDTPMPDTLTPDTPPNSTFAPSPGAGASPCPDQSFDWGPTDPFDPASLRVEQTYTLPTIGELFAKYGCDKGSSPAEPWMWSMGYERVYGPLLAPLRHKPVTLLELGWGEYDPQRGDHSNPNNGGRSAAAWRDYFTDPEAHIVVVDVEPKVNTLKSRGVALYQGSQDDPEFLRNVYLQTGPYDIIIDDASHVSSLTIKAFEMLWPYLKPGGIYVVEDLHSSMHPWYFGPDEACDDPGDMSASTAVNFFRRLATEPFFNAKKRHGPKVRLDDGTKSRTEWDCFNRKFWLGYQMESITFASPQIIVIRKRLECDYALR